MNIKEKMFIVTELNIEADTYGEVHKKALEYQEKGWRYTSVSRGASGKGFIAEVYKREEFSPAH